MEMLEEKIKKFLAVDVGYGYGFGCGSCDFYGKGSGGGCSGNGDGDGDGSGYGMGYGSDAGFGHGSNYSTYGTYDDGNDCGSGSLYCTGSGKGYGDGIKEINGKEIYMVDYIPTIFKSIRNNIAKGFIVKNDLQFDPCYIVKENNQFAHGDTLKDAYMSLQEKLYDYSTEEERIEAFKKQFPEYDVKYNNRDLFVYHHVLTGSCRMGREAFMSNKGLSLDGKTSVREFVKLTQDAYGGDIIKKLPEAYGN
jgi:hypothetical protein